MSASMPNKWKHRRLAITMTVLILLACAIGGWITGWYTASTLEDQIHEAQIEMLKDILREIAARGE